MQNMQHVCVFWTLHPNRGQSVDDLVKTLRGLLTRSEVKESLDWLMAKGWAYTDCWDDYVVNRCGYHTGRIYSDRRGYSRVQ